MFEPLRLATPDEIAAHGAKLDLTPESRVYAMTNPRGGTDLAVVRPIVEVDPFFPAEASDTRRKALFVWTLENYLRLSGVREYHFSVRADDTAWQEIVQKWGASPTYHGDHRRFRKAL